MDRDVPQFCAGGNAAAGWPRSMPAATRGPCSAASRGISAPLGGTSSAGLRSKKPNGLSQNETVSTGMIGQSSGRVMR